MDNNNTNPFDTNKDNKPKRLALTDFVNPKNIKNFVQGYMNVFKEKTMFFDLDPHIKEQAIYRAALCVECTERTYCDGCGCKTPVMFYAPKKTDHRGRWKEMLEPAAWEEFKRLHNITIPNIDLAKMEFEREYDQNTLDHLPPWELRQLMTNLLSHLPQEEVNRLINPPKED
jgi:hypothetical protein